MNNNHTSYADDSFPNWTVEEFDSIQENHHFSRRYRMARNKTIRDYRKGRTPKWSFRTAAAMIIACLVFPVSVYASVAHADFFRNAFGNAGRDSVVSHQEQVDNGKGGTTVVTYPEKTYVPIDVDQAEKIIGEQTSTEPVTVAINDHKLTILSAVRDRNAMTMEYTLECSTGVKAYDFNSLSNEAKGPGLAEDATFRFCIENAGEKVFIDQNKSTDTCLHCYAYYVFNTPLDDGEQPILDIYYADTPLLSLPEDETPKEKQISVPAASAVAVTQYFSAEGGCLELSPISCSIDLSKGLGLSEEEAYDPGNLKTLSIHYSDGTVYDVCDTEADIDNSSYILGGVGEKYTNVTLNLNRLVDVDKVDYVTVNGITYTADK